MTFFYLPFNILIQQWIQDFSDRGHQPQTGAPTYYLATFHPKLHENEENWTGGDTHPKFYYVDQPLQLVGVFKTM